MSAINPAVPANSGALASAPIRANFAAAASESDANTAAAAAALNAANTHAARTDNPHALTAAQVGLGSVNNTADASKPVSAAQAAADSVVATNASTALTAHSGNVANPHAVTAAQIGLGSVDNTPDVSKPVSTAQLAALNLKAPLASPTFTGVVGLPAGQAVNGVTLSTAAGTSAFLRGDGSYAAPTGGGDMLLAGTQTITGAKTFNAGALLLNNVANTFASLFTNTNTAARTYTLKDASGTVAFTSDITGTNSGTNTGDNATNTQYSGLAATKQDTLVSATNIKTVNGTSLLGAGNIVVSASVDLGPVATFDFAMLSKIQDTAPGDTAGNYTVGQQIVIMIDMPIKGVRIYWPCTTTNTIKVSLWNAAGTRLAFASASVNSQQVADILFSTPITGQAFKLVTISAYETTGTIYAKQANFSGAFLTAGISSGQVYSFGGFYGAGDTIPNSAGDRYPVSVIL